MFLSTSGEILFAKERMVAYAETSGGDIELHTRWKIKQTSGGDITIDYTGINKGSKLQHHGDIHVNYLQTSKRKFI